MAKKARAKRSTKSKTARATAIPTRDQIIDALMVLLAVRDFTEISLADIAEEAGVSLATLRETYDSKLAIIADFSRRIDRTVLDGGPADGEGVRDRLFEILMRRFDALGPYKDAVGHMAQALRADPCLAGFAHRNATRSAKAMLASADPDSTGLFGAIARQGLVLVHAEALRVWLDDDDPGLAKTMVALDRGLERGARAMNFAGGICAALRPFLCHRRTNSDAAAADA
jgi:AcrR family transcriptional regulator